MKSPYTDMTKGPIPRQLLFFSLPMMSANILQLLYGSVDMLVVSRVIGDTGVAAVSNGSRFGYLISSMCIGLSAGGTVVVARYFAKGDIRGQKEAVGTMFCLSGILAALVTLIGLWTFEPLLSLMDVPAEALEDTIAYTGIICGGTVFVFGYNTVCAVMRAFGNSLGPLYFVAIATVLNVILDIILVGPLGMGVKGAAVATIVSQGISFAAAVIHLRRHNFVFDFTPRRFILKPKTIKMILGIGLPCSAQILMVNISFLIVTGMLNPYGVSVAAASGIGLKINTLAGMPCWAIGQAMTAMVAQNCGVGDVARVKRIVYSGIKMNLAVTISLVVAVQLFAEQLIGLFVDTPEVVGIGVHYLRVCCSWNCVFYVTMYCLDSFALGVGRPGVALFNSLTDALLAKLALAWIASEGLGMGYTGVFYGQAFSAVFPALLGSLFFFRGSWKQPA